MQIPAHFEKDGTITLRPKDVLDFVQLARGLCARLAVEERADPGGEYIYADYRTKILKLIRKFEPTFGAYCDSLLPKEKV